jgi:DNA (cytosine-5)-methyltransferase 1
MNFYNENDPKAAAWLRELMKEGLIPEGIVDERSIADIWPNDLRGFVQCHFFAGIGGWPLALRLAGWPEDRRAWTGSCPCQPFSAAGKRRGTRDARHLWPKWVRLIAECGGFFGVPTIFGEQVASADGRIWLSGVRSSLAHLGYKFGAADLCSAGVGAPNIRQRLWWVAQSRSQPGRGELLRSSEGVSQTGIWAPNQLRGSGGPIGLANSDEGKRRRLADGEGRERNREASNGAGREQGKPSSTTAGYRSPIEPTGSLGGLANGERTRLEVGSIAAARGELQATERSRPDFWDNYDLIPCADGKTRRVESGVKPLVAGLQRGMVPSGDPSIQEAQASAKGRVMRLRGYGNAINPWVAAEFIKAYLDAENE